MKDEHYNKLVEKFGLEKANRIKRLYVEYKRELTIREIQRVALQQKYVGDMIPKEELVDMAHYQGHRERGMGNVYVAVWDKKQDRFYTVDCCFGEYVIERINHFADELETNIDGFIPLVRLTPIIKTL